MAIVTTFLEAGTDETFGFAFYTASTNATSVTSPVNTGPRAIRLKGNIVGGQLNSPTGILSDTGSQMSFYFRTDVLPASSSISFLQIKQAGGTLVYNMAIRSDGLILSAPTGATSVNGTTVLAVNTWYRICVSYYITNTTTFQFQVYVQPVNGSVILDSTANAGTLTNVTTSAFTFSSSNLTTRSHYYDDIYTATGGASSSSQPDTGDIHVTVKRPFANGTTNGFTATGTPSGYGSGNAQYVNERPSNVNNYVSVVGVGSAITEEYNIENIATGDVDLRGVTIIDYMGWVLAKALATETGQIIVNGIASNISITTSDVLFTKVAGSTVYPAGTGTDVGIITSTTVTTVTLEECGMVFAYKPNYGNMLLVM